MAARRPCGEVTAPGFGQTDRTETRIADREIQIGLQVPQGAPQMAGSREHTVQLQAKGRLQAFEGQLRQSEAQIHRSTGQAATWNRRQRDHTREHQRAAAHAIQLEPIRMPGEAHRDRWQEGLPAGSQGQILWSDGRLPPQIRGGNKAACGLQTGPVQPQIKPANGQGGPLQKISPEGDGQQAGPWETEPAGRQPTAQLEGRAKPWTAQAAAELTGC